MLTLLTYAHYCKKPGFFRYATMLICFTLGLLAKPMIATLPFILLMLDAWPLDRFKLLQPEDHRWRNSLHLIIEKIPLFLIGGLSIILTSVSLHGMGSYRSLVSAPMGLRIANATVSYIKYIGKMIWPKNLAVFYPFPKMIPMYQTLGALLILTCATLLFIAAYKKHGYLLVGWFWFLGTLVPAIGIIQAGLWPAMADRWAYIPMIGLFIIVAWGIADLFRKFSLKKSGLICCVLLIGCPLMIVSRHQIGYWKSGVALFKRAVAVTDNNFIAHNNLGQGLLLQGETSEAIYHFKKSLEISPRFELAHFNMGLSLYNLGRLDEAVQFYMNAVQIKPDFAAAYNALGEAQYRLGQPDKAIATYLQAININPEYAEAYSNLARAYFHLGKNDEAIKNYLMAIKVDPQFEDAYNNLGLALYRLGKPDKALPNYLHALKINPKNAETYNNAGAALVRMGETRKATVFFREALKFNPDHIAAKNNLRNTLVALGKNNKTISR